MSHKNIRAFIFDMDGTLVDNADFHIRSWVNLLNEIGIKVDPVELHRKHAGKTNVETLRGILGDRFSEQELVDFASRKESLYREAYRPHLKAVPGLPEFLDQASTAGLPMALATSADIHNIAMVLDGLGIRDYFTVVVGAEDIQNSKPHPEMFLTAANRLGVSADGCLVFEDSLSGIEAAFRAGMHVVVITTFLKSKDVIGAPGVLQAAPDFTYLDVRLLTMSHGSG